MKCQYVGDTNDYRKYGLIRKITGDRSLTLGICWMLTAPDQRNDGLKISYLDLRRRWRHFDPPLYDLMAKVRRLPDMQRLEAIERSGILPVTLYQNELLTDNRAKRESYFQSALAALSAADLIFFDPDNGIVPTSGKPDIGNRNSCKFIYWHELRATYTAGHSIMIYQHFRREERAEFIAGMQNQLRNQTGSSHVCTFRTPHVAFLVAFQQQHYALMPDLATKMAGSWGNQISFCS